MLEIAAARREREMWERRFKALYRAHPIWRTADNDGSWGLRDFLNYAGQICGFASGMETRQGQDRETGLVAEHDSPTRQGDAQSQPLGNPLDTGDGK